MRDDWVLVPLAIRLAQRSMRIAKLNIGFKKIPARSNMDSCCGTSCTREQSLDTCRRCGARGQKVGRQTIESLLSAEAWLRLKSGDYFFDNSPDFQLLLALGAFAEVTRRLIFGSAPEAPLMAGVAFAALAANVTCMWLLARHRSGGAHMKASWIFTTNDVVANLGVIAAAADVSDDSRCLTTQINFRCDLRPSLPEVDVASIRR